MLNALLAQVQALAPGGVLVVCFWPSTVEQDGPWAQFRALLAARSAAAGDFVGLFPPSILGGGSDAPLRKNL